MLPFVANSKYNIRGLILWNAVIDMEYANNPSSAIGKSKWSKRRNMLDRF